MPHASLRLPLACALLGALSASALAQDWPHWRGPHYNGAVAAKDLPKTFGPDENVRWAAKMPGPGASTPIVLGDRIFLTSVDSARERLVAICLDRKTGDVVWQRVADRVLVCRWGETAAKCTAMPQTTQARVLVSGW